MPLTQQTATDAANRISSAPASTAGIDEVWPFLNEGLDHIMNSSGGDGVSYLEYTTLYTTVYNYCTSVSLTKTGNSEETRSGVYLQGRKLYDKLRQYFFDHLRPMKAATLSDEDLLRYYAAEWDRYITGANYANRLFTFLNRHWVELAKTKEDVLPVYSLALALWKDNFLSPFYSKLSAVTLRLITQHRDGEAIDQGVVDKVVDSFVSLGLENPTLSAKESHDGRG